MLELPFMQPMQLNHWILCFVG